jgi:hypothetical protein
MANEESDLMTEIVQLQRRVSVLGGIVEKLYVVGANPDKAPTRN